MWWFKEEVEAIFRVPDPAISRDGSLVFRRFNAVQRNVLSPRVTDRVTPDGEPVGLQAGVGRELLGWSVPRHDKARDLMLARVSARGENSR